MELKRRTWAAKRMVLPRIATAKGLQPSDDEAAAIKIIVRPFFHSEKFEAVWQRRNCILAASVTRLGKI
jgi:hypothetical protein